MWVDREMLKSNKLCGFGVALLLMLGSRVAIASENNLAGLIRQGQVHFQQGQYHDAIATFTQAILLDPDSATPYFHRGKVRFELEDDFGALEDFDDAVQRNSRFAEAYLYRGSVRLSLGDQTNGLVDLRQAAGLFAQQGNQKEYQRAIQLIRQFNPDLTP